MKITSKNKLIEYIKMQLGHPIIQIELHDMQISQIIDDTIQKFTEYTYSYLEDTVILELNGKGNYKLPEQITNIIKLSGTSNRGLNFDASYGEGNVPQIWSEMFFSMNLGTGNSQPVSIMSDMIPMLANMSNLNASISKYMEEKISYNFNPHKKILQILENRTGPVLLHYNYEYLANNEFDYIFDHEWVKEYATAKSKLQWGNNIGKFTQNLVGGATLNYDRIISEAQQEIERLNQELITKWCDPAPISIW